MSTKHERRAAYAAARATEPGEEPTMKIQFAHVTFAEEVSRLASEKGFASSTTAFFDAAKAGVTIELDTATGLVRLSKGALALHFPLSRIKQLGEVVKTG